MKVVKAYDKDRKMIAEYRSDNEFFLLQKINKLAIELGCYGVSTKSTGEYECVRGTIEIEDL